MTHNTQPRHRRPAGARLLATTAAGARLYRRRGGKYFVAYKDGTIRPLTDGENAILDVAGRYPRMRSCMKSG